MKPRVFNRLQAILGRPLFGTTVTPPGARVDPRAFPDHEFPVYCPGCGYLLHGLPEPICPECGSGFDRGRLLVAQYLERNWRGAAHSREQRVLFWLMLAGFGVLLAGYGGQQVIAWRLAKLTTAPAGTAAPVAATAALLIKFAAAARIAQIFSAMALLTAGVWALLRIRSGSEKRRRILLALDRQALPR